MDLSRYLGLFVADAREHLSALEADAVRLEGAADEGEKRSRRDSIYRHLHSLKSAAATMGFEPMARLAHLAESLVGPAGGGPPPAGPEIDLLLAAADALARMADAAAAGRPLPLAADVAARLAGAVAPGPAPAAAPPAAPAAPPAPPAGPTTRVRVRVASRAAFPAARAFLALRRLESVAEVVRCEPARDALREGRFPGPDLVVVLQGRPPRAQVEAALARLPDLERVDVEPEGDAPSSAPPRAAPRLPPDPGDQTVRVRVELLDQLLELAGELVLSSSRVRDLLRRLPAPATLSPARGELDGESDRLRLLVKDLHNRVLAARQTPVGELAERLPRTVRDLSRRLEKPLRLETEGAEVALDRGLVEALAEPVLHVVRNAADHGIEPPAERRAAGKPAEGRIVFAARRERDRVVVEVRDDGRGFDLARLRAEAVRRGLLAPADAERIGDEEALRLAFVPGLSTRESAGEVSGRGVGMDAVQLAVEQLGGSVSVSSVPSIGSTVRFVLPTTVSVVNLLLVGLGAETFGVPMSRVLRAVESGPGPDGRPAGEEAGAHRLGELLGLPESPPPGARPWVLVDAEGRRLALGVDRLLGQEEVVLRPLGMPMERIRGLAGTAILGSGRPVFVLDVPRLVA